MSANIYRLFMSGQKYQSIQVSNDTAIKAGIETLQKNGKLTFSFSEEKILYFQDDSNYLYCVLGTPSFIDEFESALKARSLAPKIIEGVSKSLEAKSKDASLREYSISSL